MEIAVIVSVVALALLVLRSGNSNPSNGGDGATAASSPAAPSPCGATGCAASSPSIQLLHTQTSPAGLDTPTLSRVMQYHEVFPRPTIYPISNNGMIESPKPRQIRPRMGSV